jgi:hypothetical protein
LAGIPAPGLRRELGMCRTSVRGNDLGEEVVGCPGRLTIAPAVFLLPQIGN